MANLPPKACRCGLRIPAGERCPRCTAQQRRTADLHRGSARQRGYTVDWDALSKNYLQENPVCERCDREGRVTPAALVHHRRPINEGGDVFVWENLEALCRPCHKRTHDEMAVRV